MNTAVAPNVAHITSSNDVYDPDEVLPRDSPLLQPHLLNLRLSSSPPPQVPLSQVSPPSSPSRSKSNHRQKVRPSQGDAVLISYMGGGRNPQLAATAGAEALPSDEELGLDDDDDDDSDDDDSDGAEGGQAGEEGRPRLHGGVPGKEDMSLDISPPLRTVDADFLRGSRAVAVGGVRGDGRLNGMVARPGDAALEGKPFTALQSLAAGALGALSHHEEHRDGADRADRPPPTIDSHDKPRAQEPPQAAVGPREMLGKDDRSSTSVSVASPYSPNGNGLFSPLMHSLSPIHHDMRSSPNVPLPPIHGMGSPRPEGNSSSLPSIQEQLGDLRSLPDPHRAMYAHASLGMSRFGAIGHASPPVSPNTAQGITASSSYPYHALPVRPDYNSSTTETPSTEHSASTPATSITDRISIDGLNNPVNAPPYICKVVGCGAPPFQTQYLLNSHANVHSSARPHYCPVKGCSRSEGGKGFKRKNEMIRHGLVHDSPGYVCPFCPDREHKYPRPDNLQR